MTEPGLRQQFERFLLAWSGRDMDYHKRYGTNGLEFAWACWKAARNPDLEDAIRSLEKEGIVSKTQVET